MATNCDKRSYAQKLWRVARQQALSLLHGKEFSETPVLMIHDRMREFFIRSGFADSRLEVLRNPVEPFTTARVQAERNDVFYFIGRVEAEKGVEDAAAAARRAGVRLRVIGDGPERAAIAGRYPQVEVLGWSTRAEIGSTIADAKALEEAALAELHARRPDRVLATNVEYWAAVVLDFAEVPAHMFTAMFTCARTAGWSAHILEQKATGRLIRPSARYVGPKARPVKEVPGAEGVLGEV